MSSKALTVIVDQQRERQGRYAHAGQPTAYRVEFCDMAKALGAEGYSLAEIGAAFGYVGYSQLDLWAKANPEFLEALKVAKELELAWWERQGREHIAHGAVVSSGLYGKIMSGRFPKSAYRNKVEVVGDGGGPVQVDVTSAKERLRQKMRQMAEAMQGEAEGAAEAEE